MSTEPKSKAQPTPSVRLTLGGKETLMDQITKFFGDESGASAVEYAFLVTFIAVAIAASISTFTNALQALFQSAATKLPPAT